MTRHRLSAYSRDLLTPHLWIAVCIRSAFVMQKSDSPHHPCIESVPSCVVLARVARTTLRGSWVHTLRMVAEQLVGYNTPIHGSTSSRQLMSCLRGWSISRMKGCKNDRDRVILRRRCNQHVSKSHRYTHSWQAEVVHLSNNRMDNMASQVQGLRVRSASEDEGSLRPCYTEGLRACGQQ